MTNDTHLAAFPMTNWSLVGRAGGVTADTQRDALNRLLLRYLPALKAHLVYRKRIQSAEADDLVQSFVASRILEKRLVDVADAGRGRFRTLLLTALDNFYLNETARKFAKKRAPDNASASLDANENQHRANTIHDPSQAFDTEWARQLIAQTVDRMQAECVRSERSDIWIVFEGRVVAPLLQGAESVDYNELVSLCGFMNPVQASNALVTAKRMFVRVLREVVSEYVTSEEELNFELTDLVAKLSA